MFPMPKSVAQPPPDHAKFAAAVAWLQDSELIDTRALQVEAGFGEDVLSIGMFVAAADPVVVSDAKGVPVRISSQDVPGADWLQAPYFSSAPSPEEVVAAAMAVGGRKAMRCRAPLEAGCVISRDACAALIAQVDGAWEARECAHRHVTADYSRSNALEHSVRSGGRPQTFFLSHNMQRTPAMQRTRTTCPCHATCHFGQVTALTTSSCFSLRPLLLQRLAPRPLRPSRPCSTLSRTGTRASNGLPTRLLCDARLGRGAGSVSTRTERQPPCRWVCAHLCSVLPFALRCT